MCARASRRSGPANTSTPQGGTLDYMLMFIPNEQVYGFIHENDPHLLDEALQRKVVLCSPLTLFAILAVIRQASENFKLAQQTNGILGALGDFQQQWGMFKEQMDKVDRALKSSRKAYAELREKRTRQLDRQVERVDDLRVTAGIDDGGDGGEPADPAPQITASRTLRTVGAGSDRP